MSKQLRCPQCNHHFDPPVSDEAERAPQETVTFGSSESMLRQKARGGRRTLRGTVIRWSAVVMLFLLGAALMAVMADWVPFVGRRQPAETRASTQPAVVRPRPTRSASDTDRKRRLARLVEALENSIVKIETGGPGGTRSLGTGFVVGSEGFVATNYHVVSEATEGSARFKDQTVYEIEGYAAVRPDLDLAVIKLRDPPPKLPALALRTGDDPLRLEAVVAIGHPRGVEFSPFDGKVSRVLNTSQLPEASRQFLSNYVDPQADVRWVQHTAQLSEGNSGGPLLNLRGQVIGVNTWVDTQTGFSYALHGRHLTELLAGLSGQVVPLERFAKAGVQQAAAWQRLSDERIEQLYEQAVAMNWGPRSREDYETLQQLAWAVTVARFPDRVAAAGSLSEEVQESVVAAADRIELRLQQGKWDAFGQFTIVNEYAVQQVDKPMAGLFLFATVERIVEGDGGSRGMLMRLAGFDTLLFLRRDGQLVDPAPGTHCLVLGINDGGQTVRFGDNPLQPTIAPVIASSAIFPLDK